MRLPSWGAWWNLSKARHTFGLSILKYILLALFGGKLTTPPTVFNLETWNFHHSPAMVPGWSRREDFWILPPQPAPGSKRCLQCRSGGPSAYFRAFFAKEMLLGISQIAIYIVEMLLRMSLGANYIEWVFGCSPHMGLKAQKDDPWVDLESLLLT